MSTTDSIEVAAASVEDATRQALDKLGANEADVVVEVLATPRAGVLGLGVRQARVRVTRREPSAASARVQPPAPADSPPAKSQSAPPRRDERPPREPRAPREPRPPRDPRRPRNAGQQRDQRQQRNADQEPARASSAAAEDSGEESRKTANVQEQLHEASAILAQILEIMGEKAEVKESSFDPEALELEIKGDGSGILIGRHGQTLDSLEYLVNRILARRIKDAAPISVETESYRARRRQQLHRMALSMGERAKREHEPVRLEPMPPRDRRVVHLALKDDPMITTRSAGDSFMRSIEIVPVERRRERERDNRPRERERTPEPDNALGEQGGFKHGQKRIV
jgi:spoIIIJ-associated protein